MTYIFRKSGLTATKRKRNPQKPLHKQFFNAPCCLMVLHNVLGLRPILFYRTIELNIQLIAGNPLTGCRHHPHLAPAWMHSPQYLALALMHSFPSEQKTRRGRERVRHRDGDRDRQKEGGERERANSKVTPERCHSAVCPCRLRGIGHPGHTHSLCVAVEC